jgi:hypothetical protein
MTESITIRVDSEAAKAFRSSTPEKKLKLEILINLKLLEFAREQPDLKEIMQEISKNAQTRGLTPEILERLLNDEAK